MLIFKIIQNMTSLKENACFNPCEYIKWYGHFFILAKSY